MKKSASSLIGELKRKTRKNYSSEDKIRIIIEGIPGDVSVAELCRQEGIAQANYCKWSKEFIEAGKKRLLIDLQIDLNFFFSEAVTPCAQ